MDLYDVFAKHGTKDPFCISDCPPGWIPLVDRCFGALRFLGWDGTVSQVKEKFGGLRLYLDHIDPDWKGPFMDGPMQLIMSYMESQSYRTCQDCGITGAKHRCDGWYRTTCRKCESARSWARNKRIA